MEFEQNNVIVWNTPNHPKFNLFNKRLDSFRDEGWPIGLAQRPKTLAEAGFFYFGRGDNVVCYYCNIQIHNWLQEDDAWTEHAKHSPNCAYLNLIKSRNFIVNVQNNVSEEKKQQNEINGITTIFPSSNLEPTNKNVLPSGKHQSFFQKVVKTCCKKDENNKQENSLQETLTQLQDERMCQLCTAKEANIIFIPCGHLLVCKYCAAPLTDCPVCRCKINEFVKVYFS